MDSDVQDVNELMTDLNGPVGTQGQSPTGPQPQITVTDSVRASKTLGV